MTTGPGSRRMHGSMRLHAGLLALAVPLLGGCGKPDAPAPDTRPPGPAATLATDRVAALWGANCALCHVDGKGGAPRLGDAAAWQPRIAQGDDVLLQHTLEGFNNMPPLGYCMSCERAEFEALIHFMTGAI